MSHGPPCPSFLPSISVSVQPFNLTHLIYQFADYLTLQSAHRILDHNVLSDLPTYKRLKPSEPASPSNAQIETKVEAERSQIFGAYEDQASEKEEEEVNTSVRDCKGRHFSATKEAELRLLFQIIIKAEGPCPSYEFEMSGHQLANVASWQTYSATSGGQKGKTLGKRRSTTMAYRHPIPGTLQLRPPRPPRPRDMQLDLEDIARLTNTYSSLAAFSPTSTKVQNSAPTLPSRTSCENSID